VTQSTGYILDVVLEQPTSLRPTEIVSDTAGYADVVFGIFALLGYQFSPRLADLGEDISPYDRRHRCAVTLAE